MSPEDSLLTTKTVEELLYDVNGAKIFSKLDIIKAFHQLQLEDEQMNLTTITTHEGLLRYRRLHMGISCALEVFSEHIRTILLLVLKKHEERRLTLNLEKCEFYKEEITFYGLRFTKDGVSPTEER